MFIGHFAAAFAAKKVVPSASLGTLFLAAQFVDLLWPVLVLTGLESFRIAPGITAVSPLEFVSYPISHSLLTAIGWSVLVALLWCIRPRPAGAAVWVGLVCFSHWLLDFVSHRPDLPLWPGGTKVGLGLWQSIPATVLIEGSLFVLAVWRYARTTRATDRTGSRALWSLVGLLVALYLGNLLGPPPPDVRTVAVGALSLWLVVAWGYWMDRHRQVQEQR